MLWVLICLMVLYTVLGGFAWFWRNRRSGQTYPLNRELAVLTGALLLHSAAVWWPVAAGRVLLTGFGPVCVLISWLVLMLYFGGSFFYRLSGLQLLLYPLSAAGLLLAVLFPGKPVAHPLGDWPLMLHLAASLLAYSLFAVAALLAVLILWLSRDLHRHKIRPGASFLPPLLSLEKLMFQGMWAGFALLTVSLISGTFFAEAVFGKPAGLTHKTVFGVLGWLIYAALLFKRSMSAWRGKKVAVWTIVGFISLMLAYIGSKFVLEIILRR